MQLRHRVDFTKLTFNAPLAAWEEHTFYTLVEHRSIALNCDIWPVPGDRMLQAIKDNIAKGWLVIDLGIAETPQHPRPCRGAGREGDWGLEIRDW
jgi:hypothetical protein